MNTKTVKMTAICCLLTLFLIFANYAQPIQALGEDASINTDEDLLSEMSWEDQLVILEAYGVVFTESFPPEGHKEFIQSTIASAEKDGSYILVVNSPVTKMIGEQIVNAVNEYYGRKGITTKNSDAFFLRGLNDSTILGTWSDSYYVYNCYAYAVGKTDDFYWPGMYHDVPNKTNFDISKPISVLALHVKHDLLSSHYSYNCVKITNTKPSSFQTGQKCICIRKSTDDFHFMKLSSNGNWLHKPSWTNPLKYKYVPSYSRAWTNEAYGKDPYTGIMTYYPVYETYNSYLRFITFQTNHTVNYGYTGESYHSGAFHYYKYGDICQECGDVSNVVWIKRPCSGPPCVEIESCYSTK